MQNRSDISVFGMVSQRLFVKKNKILFYFLSFLDPLKTTGLTPDDVVLDIGSGDGRVLVTAAKMLGCRGIGIDVSKVKDYAVPPQVSASS